MSRPTEINRRTLETPFGDVVIVEELCDKEKEGEHWVCIQDVSLDSTEWPNETNLTTGIIIGSLLKQYTVSASLVREGYEFHSIIDGSRILWVNYT